MTFVKYKQNYNFCNCMFESSYYEFYDENSNFLELFGDFCSKNQIQIHIFKFKTKYINNCNLIFTLSEEEPLLFACNTDFENSIYLDEYKLLLNIFE